MTVTIEVDDQLPSDLRLLAMAVLKGDESAAMPMIDCAIENMKGKERITPAYCEMLEDHMLEVRKQLTEWQQDSEGGRYELVTIYVSDLERLRQSHFKCEQVARSLKRFGLS